MSNILIIDDDFQLRKMLRQMLERSGYEVAEASDGDMGIKACREDDFDLVITDIVMPNKEGIETIMELKRAYPEIKILAMSGGGRNKPEDYLFMAEKLGAEQTLSKPFEREDFLGKVSKILE